MWFGIALMALASSPLPALQVKGGQLVDPAGKPVILRGCNFGSWFVIEMWMWDHSDRGAKDQFDFEKLLSERFGAAEKDRLMEVYRKNWITERDWKMLRDFRFNCVRLPLNYRLFEDDDKPFQLRKDAWKWVDHAVREAKRHGIYLILDMHGVQGGQSVYDHTGRVDQNKLWTDPENPKRLAWLWGEIAKRYRNEPAVAAYDVFNEPYGGSFEDIRRVFAQSYASIRKNDPDKLIWAHGRYDGFSFYEPDRSSWHNVGIQMHYYPGLFGNGNPTVRTHQRHFNSLNQVVAPEIRRWKVPFLVGEMNVVFNGAGGGEMMRRTYDLHESHGWHTTMWSYKALGRSGGVGDACWGMVVNRDPFAQLDFRTASKDEIEAWMKLHGTMAYAVNEPLRDALAPLKKDLPPLPELAARTEAPQKELSGWQQTDVGGPLKGGLEPVGDGFRLFGGGRDIWGARDEFRFLHQAVSGDFELETEIEGLEDLASYCKAGPMLRLSMDPDSPHVLLSVFPSGEVQMAYRREKGKDTEAAPIQRAEFPIRLRLSRKGSQITGEVFRDGAWTSVGHLEIPSLAGRAQVGVVAMSQSNSELVEARYKRLTLRLP